MCEKARVGPNSPGGILLKLFSFHPFKKGSGLSLKVHTDIKVLASSWIVWLMEGFLHAS